MLLGSLSSCRLAWGVEGMRYALTFRSTEYRVLGCGKELGKSDFWCQAHSRNRFFGAGVLGELDLGAGCRGRPREWPAFAAPTC